MHRLDAVREQGAVGGRGLPALPGRRVQHRRPGGGAGLHLGGVRVPGGAAHRDAAGRGVEQGGVPLEPVDRRLPRDEGVVVGLDLVRDGDDLVRVAVQQRDVDRGAGAQRGRVQRVVVHVQHQLRAAAQDDRIQRRVQCDRHHRHLELRPDHRGGARVHAHHGHALGAVQLPQRPVPALQLVEAVQRVGEVDDHLAVEGAIGQGGVVADPVRHPAGQEPEAAQHLPSEAAHPAPQRVPASGHGQFLSVAVASDTASNSAAQEPSVVRRGSAAP